MTTSRLAVLVFGFAFALPAAAEKLAVGPITGPGAAAVQAQLKNAACDGVECVDAAKIATAGKVDWKKASKWGVTHVITGVVTKRGKNSMVSLQLVSGPGKAAARHAGPLVKGVLPGKDLAAFLADVDPVVKPPPPTPVAPVVDVETRRAETLQKAPLKEPETPVVVDVETRIAKTPPPDDIERQPKARGHRDDAVEAPSSKAHAHVLAVDVAVAMFNRQFSWANATSGNLRQYDLPFFPAPRVGVTLSPFMGKRDDAVEGLGLEASADLQAWLMSNKRKDSVMYPTQSLRFDGAVRWAFRLPGDSPISLVPAVGLRDQIFTTAAAKDGSKLDGLPNLAFLGARVSLGAEGEFLDRQLVLALRGSLLPVFTSGEIIGGPYFAKGSNFGFSVDAALGFRVTEMIQVRAGFEFVQYGLSFSTQATDMYVAAGATERLVGGSVGVRVEL